MYGKEFEDKETSKDVIPAGDVAKPPAAESLENLMVRLSVSHENLRNDVADIKQDMSGLKKEVSDNGKSIVKLSTQLESTEKNLKTEIDTLGKRFDGFEKRFDNLDKWHKTLTITLMGIFLGGVIAVIIAMGQGNPF